jgi:outer membrane lipopolysaccharide assembly protein LptE/RlpB
MSAARHRVSLPAALLLIACAGGCGYRLAGKNQLLPTDVRVIAVPPFENQTRRPEIDQRITEQMTATLIKRGGYRTTGLTEGADAILSGSVTGYNSSPVSVGSDGRATRYEVVITASVQLRKMPEDRILFSSSHFVFKKQYDVSDEALSFSDQEIVAIDEIARDFSESVVTSILEGF